MFSEDTTLMLYEMTDVLIALLNKMLSSYPATHAIIQSNNVVFFCRAFVKNILK